MLCNCPFFERTVSWLLKKSIFFLAEKGYGALSHCVKSVFLLETFFFSAAMARCPFRGSRPDAWLSCKQSVPNDISLKYAIDLRRFSMSAYGCKCIIDFYLRRCAILSHVLKNSPIRQYRLSLLQGTQKPQIGHEPNVSLVRVQGNCRDRSGATVRRTTKCRRRSAPF